MMNLSMRSASLVLSIMLRRPRNTAFVNRAVTAYVEVRKLTMSRTPSWLSSSLWITAAPNSLASSRAAACSACLRCQVLVVRDEGGRRLAVAKQAFKLTLPGMLSSQHARRERGRPRSAACCSPVVINISARVIWDSRFALNQQAYRDQGCRCVNQIFTL